MKHFAIGTMLVLFLFTLCAGADGDSTAVRHASLPRSVVPDCFGVNIHFIDPRPGELKMIADAGFKWVRMDLDWPSTEHHPWPGVPQSGPYEFASYDRLIAGLEEHGLRAIFILAYGNPLYAAPGEGHPWTSRAGTPEFRDAFAKWAVTVVNRYKGHGHLWELWNEPNVDGFWKPQPNVADYVALVNATGAALTKAGLIGPKGEAFIGPAASGVDLGFTEDCFKAGLLTYWDAVSVHPYRREAPETVAADYHNLRQLIGKYAPPNKDIPIISGEWGYSDAWEGFDREKQANYLTRQFLTNAANGLPLSIWYDWRDDGLNPTDPEHHFGMVGYRYHSGREPVLDHKPAYVAYRTLAQVLREKRFIGEVACGDGIRCLEFTGVGGAATLAAWTPSGVKTLSLSTSSSTVVATDLQGNPTTLALVDGRLCLAVTEEPIFISGVSQAKAAPPLLSITGPTTSDERFTLDLAEAPGFAADPLIVTLPHGWTSAVTGTTLIVTAPPTAIAGEYPLLLERGTANAGAILVLDNIVAMSVSAPQADLVRAIIRNPTSRSRTVDIQPSSSGIAYEKRTFEVPAHGEKSVDIPVQSELEQGYAPVAMLLDQSLINHGQGPVVRTPGSSQRITGGSARAVSVSGIAVDGGLAEWTKHKAHLMNLPFQYVALTGQAFASENANDCSARFWIGWSDQHAYLAVQVSDDLYSPKTLPLYDMWRGDSVQFAFAVGGIRHEFDVAVDAEGIARIHQRAPTEGTPAGVVSAGKRIGQTTTYEIALPWKLLGVAAPKHATALGFSLLVNDNDGDGRKGWVQWFDGIGSSKDTTLYGALRLLTTP